MLQYRTVYPETLELLKRLMKVKELQDFFLVGETALALHLGHRISVDIEPNPITTEPSDWNEIKKTIIRKTNEYVRN